MQQIITIPQCKPAVSSQVRHPVPAEPEEIEMEDNYEDDEEDDSDVMTVEVGDVPTPSLWLKRTEARMQRPKVRTKTTTARDFPEETRKVDTKLFRGEFMILLGVFQPCAMTDSRRIAKCRL